MPSELCLNPPAATLAAIDNASALLRRVADRVLEAGVLARRLAASTDWQTPAARAFHVLASQFSDDAIGLAPMTDAVMAEIARARTHAMSVDSWDCR